MIKGALIDFGGTIDTDGIHWMRMFSMAYEACRIPEDNLRDAYVFAERTLGSNRIIMPDFTFHRTLETKIQLQMEYLGLTDMSGKVADFCYQYVADNIRKVSAPVLAMLSERMPLVLVSNFYGNMHTVLHEFGIDRYFKSVVESAVVGRRKPEPEIFRIGVNTIAILPQDAVVIGDSPDKDIQPASSIGCHTVWLRGKGWSDAVTCVPEYTIPSFRELINLDFC